MDEPGPFSSGEEIMDPHGHSGAREYSIFAVVISNLPYAAMILLGSMIMLVGLEYSRWGYIAGGAYVVYGALGALWIICFLCPYCVSHGTRLCPCGYGILSARLRAKRDTALFTRKFKRHIAIIVPLWLVPVVVGSLLALNSFRWPIVILLGVFILDSFVLLPLISRSYGCNECPQKGVCPWILHK